MRHFSLATVAKALVAFFALLALLNVAPANAVGNSTLWEVKLWHLASDVRYVVSTEGGQCGNATVLVVTGSAITAYSDAGIKQFAIMLPKDISTGPHPPVIAKHTVVQIIQGYGVLGFDCGTGVFKWLHEDAHTRSGLSVSLPKDWVCYGTAFFNSGRATVNCIDASTGAYQWGTGECATCSNVPAVVTIGNGVVWFEVDEAGNGYVVGRGFRGEERFRTAAPQSFADVDIQLAVSHAAGTVIFGTGALPEGFQPWVAGFQLSTGTLLWTQNNTALTRFASWDGVVVGNAGVYGQYYAYRASQGQQLWSSTACMGVQCSPPVGRCNVAIISTQGGTSVAQVDITTGSVLQQTHFDSFLVVDAATGPTLAYILLQRGYDSPAYLTAVQGAWSSC